MKKVRAYVAVLMFSVLLPSGLMAHSGEGEKNLFTKHFHETLFTVSEKGQMSIEVLLNEKEYKIGRDVIGIVVHDSHDEDVEGASLKAVLTLQGGIRETPPVKEKGGGLYLIPAAQFPKDGPWELQITVRKGKIDDSVVFTSQDMSRAPLRAGQYNRESFRTK